MFVSYDDEKEMVELDCDSGGDLGYVLAVAKLTAMLMPR